MMAISRLPADQLAIIRLKVLPTPAVTITLITSPTEHSRTAEVIMFLAPILVTLLAWAIFRDRPGANLIAGPAVVVTKEQVIGADPEAIIVSPCGLNLEQTRTEFAALASQEWFKALRAYKQGRVALVDGNQMFSRPGPRLVDAFEWMVGWFTGRDELIPEDFPWEVWRCD